MRRRTLHVELAGVGSLVSGHGSRELVIEVTRRPPVWLTIQRGWSVQEHTARDVVALAEGRGYDIHVIGPRAAAAPVRRFPADQEWSPVEPEDTLW